MIDPIAEQAAISGWRNGDRAAGAALLKMHAGIIAILARRFVGSMCEEEDLIQEASIALLGATADYEPSVGKFITYARRPMKWACNDYARELRHDVHVSKGAEEGARSFEDSRVKLRPSEEKTAKKNRLAIERAMVRAVRLDSFIGNTEETYIDRLAAPANDVDTKLDVVRLRLHVEGLNPRERDVLLRRCADEPETFVEIGRSMGVKRQRVEQIEKGAIAVLKKRMRAA